MNEEIEITTKFCHPYMSFGGDGCSDVVLKVPRTEAVKLQSVAHSGNENQGFSVGDLIVHSCVKMTQIRLLINQSLNDCYSLE